MESFRSIVASPAALLAFEAAGRHMSFTAAARELNVSQSAVSHAVRQLEESLGQSLFLRRHRRIELTETGERFFNDVSIGLMHIRRSAEAIRRQRDVDHVTLSASTAFASWWMVPRLASFRAALPDIDLRLQTTDKDVHLRAEGISLGIRRGRGEWDEYDCALLAPEIVYPVCSPDYRASAGPLAEPSALPGLKLIHLEEPFRPCPTWVDWFAGQGIEYVDRGEGLRLNDYALVIQAVMEGQGVALGWHHITRHLIDRGQMLQPFQATLETDCGYYVVWPRGYALSEQAERVRNWLLAAA
jgi:DNA-binding transcriptional LysR family regulator